MIFTLQRFLLRLLRQNRLRARFFNAVFPEMGDFYPNYYRYKGFDVLKAEKTTHEVDFDAITHGKIFISWFYGSYA